jgi:hypothetical protein
MEGFLLLIDFMDSYDLMNNTNNQQSLNNFRKRWNKRHLREKDGVKDKFS